MKPLSKEASAALSALKAADPTSEDEARVRKNLERALGVAIPVAGVAVATTAASAQAASGGLAALGMGAKVALVVVAVSALTTVAVVSFSTEHRAQPPPVAQAPKLAATPPPPVEPAPVVVDVPPPPPAPEVVAVVPPPPAKQHPQPKPASPEPEAPIVAVEAPIAEPAPPETPAPTTAETWNLEVEANLPNCDPATEVRSARRAHKLLDADRAEDAVWLLSAYQRRCPSGRWSNEAWSVRIAALCKLERNAEVIGLLQWFSTEAPARRALVISELRGSCPDEVLKYGEP